LRLFITYVECLFKVSFFYEKKSDTFSFNDKYSENNHNHQKDETLKSKVFKKQAEELMKKTLHEEDLTPSDFRKKFEDKFGLPLDYQDSANLLYKVKDEVFGDPSKDAQNLISLCKGLSDEFEEFFFRYEVDNKQQLKSLFFATPTMREQFKVYSNLLIMDTTFGTNRFHMPLMFGAVVNGLGRTIISFVALTTQETIEQFSWIFTCFRNCFESEPLNIITDECKSFESAIKTKFPTSNHFVCGWHKSSNIRKHLNAKGCKKRSQSNISKYN